MKNLNKFRDDLLLRLNAKQRKVLIGRFGLRGSKYTLQEIGDELGITRERVRQIEAQTLSLLRPKVWEEAKGFVESAVKFLKNAGGVRKDDRFISEVKYINNLPASPDFDNLLRFIFLVCGTPLFYKEDDNLYSFWYTAKDDKVRLMKFLSDLKDYFKKHGKAKVLGEKSYLSKFNGLAAHNLVSVSKDFGINVFGDFGLKEWPEISPKFVRDKAYLVLKNQNQPLHFSDIARLIKDLGIDSKKAHVQTVHNELIKDNRFVLVGRGLYALKEHGYEGGTAKEVIRNLLKDKGPLSSKEVVRLVSQKKILQENTILLNLQNKNYFKRLKDGRYHLA